MLVFRLQSRGGSSKSCRLIPFLALLEAVFAGSILLRLLSSAASEVTLALSRAVSCSDKSKVRRLKLHVS